VEIQIQSFFKRTTLLIALSPYRSAVLSFVSILCVR